MNIIILNQIFKSAKQRAILIFENINENTCLVILNKIIHQEIKRYYSTYVKYWGFDYHAGQKFNQFIKLQISDNLLDM